LNASFPTGQAVVGLVSGKERKKSTAIAGKSKIVIKRGVLREAKTNPAMVSSPESQRGSGDRRLDHW
jgi:hypothetical protein